MRPQICIRNSMTGEERHRTLALPLWGKGEGFALKLVPESCGELVITCEKAWVQDHLKLFSRALPPFDPVRITIYPASVGLEVILDRQDAGKYREDGPMLNRPGTDKSETFDVREYRPGDDVRAIHWKLSVKEDKPIVRIPGRPWPAGWPRLCLPIRAMPCACSGWSTWRIALPACC